MVNVYLSNVTLRRLSFRTLLQHKTASIQAALCIAKVVFSPHKFHYVRCLIFFFLFYIHYPASRYLVLVSVRLYEYLYLVDMIVEDSEECVY